MSNLNNTGLWDQFNISLRRYINKHVDNIDDAEEMLQDVFFKVHERINTLKDKDKLPVWVYRITRNTIIDYYRKRRINLEIMEIADSYIYAVDGNQVGELALCLKPMVDSLPEKYKQAIILTEYEGLTQKELADKLGLSLSGAKSRVQRARLKLKEMLLNCCHIEFDRFGNILEYHHKTGACKYCSDGSVKK